MKKKNVIRDATSCGRAIALDYEGIVLVYPDAGVSCSSVANGCYVRTKALASTGYLVRVLVRLRLDRAHFDESSSSNALRAPQCMAAYRQKLKILVFYYLLFLLLPHQYFYIIIFPSIIII